MSKDLENPDINIDMQTYYQIVERGGRPTRSNTNRNMKPQESAPPKFKPTTLSKYLGEPTLEEYLIHSNIQHSEELSLSRDYQPNKKMKRLLRAHVPQSSFYYERVGQGSGLAYRVQAGRVCMGANHKKTARMNDFYFEENEKTNLPVRYFSNDQEHNGVLVIIQTLLFYPINHDDFVKIFRYCLDSLQKKEVLPNQINSTPTFKPVPEEAEERQGAAESEPIKQGSVKSIEEFDMPDQVDEIPDSKSCRPAGGQAEAADQSGVNFKQECSLQDIISEDKAQKKPEEAEVRKQSIEQLIFNRLCLPGQDYILWPAVVLQPIVGQRSELEKMVEEKLDDPWKKKRYSAKNHLQLDSEVFKRVFESLPNLPLKDDNYESLVCSITSKRVHALSKMEKDGQSQLLIRLVGTQETMVISNNFLKWSDLSIPEQEFLISKSSFKPMIGQLNNYIDDLNRFKRIQDSKMDSKHCFMRLCKYYAEGKQPQLCIPLRLDHNKEDKRVLVRFLREGPQEEAEQDALGWVEMGRVQANLTLPRHNEHECKFYYLMGSRISIVEGLEHIYSDFFFYRPASFISILRGCYPLRQLNRCQTSHQRCIKCYYRMQHYPFYRCKYCLKYCHQECADQENRYKPQNKLHESIYETENESEVWECEGCSPCKQCQMPVLKDYFKCSTCQQLFHSICGRLKCLSQNVAIKLDRYTCQNCIKCCMCDSKLKNQEFTIHEGRIFCMKCHDSVKSNNFCILCMHEEAKAQGIRWVQCDDCLHWVHFDCDSFLRNLKQPQTQVSAEKKYWCPQCRTKLRRKVLKHVVEELRMFDEYQFYYEPTYQEIYQYRVTIKQPMCLFGMAQKAIDGSYDIDPYAKLVSDLELIVNNAMTFNMPKDEFYYRAKILLIIGKLYMQNMKPIMQCSEEFLLEENLAQRCSNIRKVFYKDLEENYLSYLLNYGNSGGIVEVQRNNPLPYDSTYFSSRLLLTRCFSDATFRLRVKKQPQKIGDLFRVPKESLGGWRSIREDTCYFHPQDKRPILFKCDECGQSYCCVTRCLACHFCTNCEIKGCACDSYLCDCGLLRQKQKKNVQSKISLALNLPNISRRQYSQYYKYCPKCCLQVAKINWCYVCQQFCYYGYEHCQVCLKVYHIECENSLLLKDMSNLFDISEAIHQSYQGVRLKGFCNQCTRQRSRVSLFKEKLRVAIRSKAVKLKLITKYLPIFNYLYEINGIRVTCNQVIQMLSANHQALLSKEPMLEEIVNNMQTVFENYSINHIEREEYRDFFLKEIARKLHNQSLQEKQTDQSFSKEFKQLKQSKKFYKICAKWFPLPLPNPFHSNREICFFLDTLTSRMNTRCPPPLLQSIPLLPLQPPLRQASSANNREPPPLNTKTLQRIKIQAITAHVSPKSKKNIYYHNLAEKSKIFLTLWTHHYELKPLLLESLELNSMQDEQEQSVRHSREQIIRQFEKYLRFRGDTQHIGDFLIRDENVRSLLVPQYHGQSISPFKESWMMVEYNPLQVYQGNPRLYANSKSEMMEKYLSSFALSIYEQNKVVLKKGNTCILGQGKQRWRILKKFKQCNYEIALYRQETRWIMQIDERKFLVETIQDIIYRISSIAPWVENFDQLVEFLGLAITDVIERDPAIRTQEPSHFTNLLQTVPLDDHSRRKRKQQVLKVYEEYEWDQQGVIRIKNQRSKQGSRTEFKVTQQPLFFLKKRKDESQASGQSQAVRSKVVPFMTFDDLRKDLEDGQVAQQKQSIIPKGHPNYNVYIAPSKIDRLGLFIRNWTRKHTVVVQYIGEVISQGIADKRQQKFHHFGCYMFSLGKNNTRAEIIDATFVGNMARYLNHSCDPNCKANIDTYNGQPRICIYTIRDVKQNQQLTYDYQFKVEAERLVCKCKAKNCQGRLN